MDHYENALRSHYRLFVRSVLVVTACSAMCRRAVFIEVVFNRNVLENHCSIHLACCCSFCHVTVLQEKSTLFRPSLKGVNMLHGYIAYYVVLLMF